MWNKYINVEKMYQCGTNVSMWNDVSMWNKCIKLLTIHVVNSVHRGKGRTTHYTLSEAVYWDFASSSKISLWRRFVCLITLDLWFIQTSLMRKHVIFFHCPGSWENLVNVCNTILVSHTEALQLCAERRNDFLAVLYSPSYFVHLYKKELIPLFPRICFHVPP